MNSQHPTLDAAPPAAKPAPAELGSTQPQVDGSPVEPTPLPANAPMPTQIGRFTVLERIGAGGMGVVYAASDPRLDRRIAIKLLRPAQDQPSAQASARLLREAMAMAKINHPNVVTIYEVGTFGDEVYVAMELIRGTTMSQWLVTKAPDWDEILDAFLQAGAGLATVHRAGLIHRDFKPSNILVGDDGVVRLADFGLVRFDEDTPEPAASPSPRRSQKTPSFGLTQVGAVMGTPAYMSPEQYEGRPVATASDQYSFCVALAEAIYGRLPFALPSTEGEHHGFALDSGAFANTQQPIPRWVADVLRRGLDPQPSKRWPSMDALLAELSRARRMGERERLREVILDLERTRAREHEMRMESQSILGGLDLFSKSASQTASKTASKTGGGGSLLDDLTAFVCHAVTAEHAVLLVEEQGVLVPRASTAQFLLALSWPFAALPRRARSVQASAFFDISRLDEWRTLPPEVTEHVRSALYVPMPYDDRHAMIICTHKARGYFSQRHAQLGRGIAVLGAQTLRYVAREAALAERNGLLDHAAEMLAIIDSQGSFAYSNHAWTDTLGHLPGALFGRDVADTVVIPEDRESLRAALAQARVSPSVALVIVVRCFAKSSGSVALRWRLQSRQGLVYAAVTPADAGQGTPS